MSLVLLGADLAVRLRSTPFAYVIVRTPLNTNQRTKSIAERTL